MSRVAEIWNECSVQKLTGSAPLITPMMAAVPRPYTNHAISNVVAMLSPARARRQAPGRQSRAGSGPMMLTMAANPFSEIRSRANATPSPTVNKAPNRMRRKKRLCGLCPSRAWLMNKKLPVMAISDASPTAWLVNQGLWPHRYCWPTPKKCKE